MTEIKTIEEWKNQVFDYLNTLNQQLLNDEYAKKMYFGFDVIDGRLKSNPDILFIGINPGAGDQKRNIEVRLETERISYLDIFNEHKEYNYQLASNTVKLLKSAGLSEIEIVEALSNNFVKTNLYHISTIKESDIDMVFNSNLEISALDFRNKSSKFCVDLINIIKPKIVVFEGKGAYKQIIEQCYEHYNTWNDTLNYGYLLDNVTGIHYIGYSRRFSNINNIENVGLKLNECMGLLK